jgi:hypothetical protein
MHRILPALIVVLAFGGAALADPDEGPVPLHSAYTSGLVGVSVCQTSGYGRVLVAVRNRTKKPVSVRIPGTYLTPTGGRHQRLALGYAERERTPTVSIPPCATWRGWVTSCCMDSGKPGPDTFTAYAVSQAPAPEKIKGIMDAWAANPTIEQGRVNDLVWGRSGAPIPPPPVTGRYDRQGLRVAAWGDRILVLYRSGELLRSRDDGKWESLGTGIQTFNVGSGRVFARFGEARVKEYNETERAWVQRGGPLPGAEEFLPGPDAVYARTGDVLFGLNAAGAWTEVRRGVVQASLSLGPDRSFLYVVGTDGRIARFDGPGKGWKCSDQKGFQRAVVSAATLYGMDARGLVRISDKGYERLYTPSGCRAVLPWRGGFVAVEGDGTAVECAEPGIWSRAPALPRGVAVACADSLTGTLLALDAGMKVWRRARGGAWEKAQALPRVDDPNSGPGAKLEPAAD